MGLKEWFAQNYIQPAVAPIQGELKSAQKTNKELNNKLQEAVKVIDIMKSQTFSMPTGYNTTPGVRRPGAQVNYDILRNISVVYDVARACINRRKRQITQLEWDIVSDDPNVDMSKDSRVKTIKEWFKQPMGPFTRFRELMDLIVEDVLVIDLIAEEKVYGLGGQFLFLKPIDSSTIKINLDEGGLVPLPPEIAYEQWIRGSKVAEFMADEIIVERMNPRTTTPYGLSPIESLILTVDAALQADMYNAQYFKSGSVPAGFVSVPEGTTSDQINTLQSWFDALLSGDPRAVQKLKILPGGSNYIPTSKPSDMQFEHFAKFLLTKTCALFDIQPQEIGFTYEVNKATGEVQNEIGQRTGMKPLAKFIEEILDDLITEEFGAKDLNFTFLGLESVDPKLEAEVDNIYITAGVYTPEYVQRRKGIPTEEIDEDKQKRQQQAADIMAGNANNQNNNQDGQNKDNQNQDNQNNQGDNANKVDEIEELHKWKRKALSDLKSDRPFRKFESDLLDDRFINKIDKKLDSKRTKDNIEKVFTKAQSELLDHINKNQAVSAAKKFDEAIAKILEV